jgi:alpha-glucosidase
MNKILAILSLIFFSVNVNSFAKDYPVSSPNKRITVNVSVNKDLKVSILFDGKLLMNPSPVSMEVNDIFLGKKAKVINKKYSKVNRKLTAEVKIKSATIAENYNQLTLTFKGDYKFTVKVFNEGVGYRFETTMSDTITVKKEIANYNFNGNFACWWAKEWSFHSNNQVYYDYKSLLQLNSNDLGSLPLILQPADGPKIVIAETDLVDYPGMWLKGAEGTSLTLTNPGYPKTTHQEGDRDVFVDTREDYIAKTSGTRTFPWRVFAIADNDGDLITNQLTYLLASENVLEDISWIKPGKIAWDWWNANNIESVDFKSGYNTDTYKYYIDFAAKYGIEYILLDEGWYELGDLLKLVPEIDVKEIVRYGKEKGVDVILWVVWKTLDDQMDEALQAFEDWGVKGIKVDFMDKDDQWMVNYFHRVAKNCADHHLLVDFHGSYKPAGIRRMYPNVLTREGVNGGEQYKWSYRQTPEHNLITPFGRMLAGPMDYTPGAMNNAQKENFKPIFNRPMSMGTRCHQLGMYVCYESPLQMLCDTPTKYYREPEAMEFLAAVPVVWDETKVLDAKVSDYLLVARRSGDKWYVGGMTDWTERELQIDFSFLEKNKKYKIIIIQDGVNANRIATDFKRVEKEITSEDSMPIKMAKGGGWVAQILPVQ